MLMLFCVEVCVPKYRFCGIIKPLVIRKVGDGVADHKETSDIFNQKGSNGSTPPSGASRKKDAISKKHSKERTVEKETEEHEDFEADETRSEFGEDDGRLGGSENTNEQDDFGFGDPDEDGFMESVDDMKADKTSDISETTKSVAKGIVQSMLVSMGITGGFNVATVVSLFGVFLVVLGIIAGVFVAPSVSLPVLSDDVCRPREALPAARTLEAGDETLPWTDEASGAYQRAKWIFNWHIDRGFNGYGAAGAVGNAALESGNTFHPAMLEQHTAWAQVPGALEGTFPGYREANGSLFHLNLFEATDLQISGSGFLNGGGIGIYQMTPPTVMLEEGNGYEYVNAWADIENTWKSMSQSNFEEVLYDPGYVEEALLVYQEFIWKLYSGAGMNAQGLQRKLLDDNTAYERIANPSSIEDAAYYFYYYVENGTDMETYMNVTGGPQRIEATELAYEMFGGENYPSADRSRIEEEWDAEIAPRSAKTGNKMDHLPYCEEEVKTVPADIAEIALALVGWWHYRQGPNEHVLGGRSLPFLADGRNSPWYNSASDVHNSDYENPHEDDGTDCSGFVSMVLYWGGVDEIYGRMENDGGMSPQAGYNNLHTVDTIVEMANDPSVSEYEIISPSEAQAGDIICNTSAAVGGLAHTAVLVEDWTGPGTMIVQMGGNMNTVNHQPATTGGFSDENIADFVRIIPKSDGRMPEGIEPKDIDPSLSRSGNL